MLRHGRAEPFEGCTDFSPNFIMGTIGSFFAPYSLASELGISLCSAEDICAQFFAAHVVEYFVARLKIFASVYVIFSKSAVQAHVPMILERCKVRWLDYSGLLRGLGKLVVKYCHFRTQDEALLIFW